MRLRRIEGWWFGGAWPSSRTKVRLMRAWCVLTGGHRWEPFPGIPEWIICAKCADELTDLPSAP